MDIKAKLKKVCGRPWHVKIQRKVDSDYSIYGFVLSCSSRLVLIHEAVDFHLNGYRIIRVSDITSVRYAKCDKQMTRMFSSEGVLDEVGLIYPVNLKSWKSVFQSIRGTGLNVIVEGEEEDVDEFVIGPVVRVNDKSASVHHFDSLGKWRKKPTRCPYAEITTVQFDCEYANVWSRYLPER